jgi:phage tail sheath gpL-like
MPISFAQIPSNIKVPLYWVEVDPSMAGLPTLNLRALLVGTMLTSSQKVSTAVPAAGGTGYVVGNTINLANGVVLTVASVTTGAVTTATVTSAGSIPAAATPPTGPQPQVSTNGPGTGATFTLTWVANPNLGAGTATPDIPVAIGTLAQAQEKFGSGSELYRLFKIFFKNNFANEVWGGPVAEAPGAAAATGTITVTAPPTEAGTIHLYIGGEHVAVNVGGTDSTAQVAQAIWDAIDADDGLPVVPSVAGSTVTLKCAWKGVNGNDIRVETNYFGQIGGEVPPPGLVLTLPATGFLTGGTSVPNFDNLIMAMGEQEFEYVCLPYTDSTSLMAWEEEYGFGDEGRWGWKRQHFGHIFSAKRGTYSDLMIFGATRNSGVMSIMAFEMNTPTPMYEMAAAYTAKAQRALSNDPARPLQTLQLAHTLPAKLHDRFNWLEINSMASTGLAIQKCWEGSGLPQIAREQTTYQLNLYGHGDDAYELVTTLATLAKILRNQRHAITSKYPRHKLANDGTRFGPGQAIVTPGIIKAELVAQYKNDEYVGLVEDARNFKRFLLVERDPDNPNRLNVLYPPDLINQLRIFAVLAQFRLQYDRGVDVEIIGYTGLSGVAGSQGARLPSS